MREELQKQVEEAFESAIEKARRLDFDTEQILELVNLLLEGDNV